MTYSVKQRVKDFILDNFMMGSEADIRHDASFMDNHIIDSTGFLELIIFIQEAFHIRVSDSEMVPENLDNLDAIATLSASAALYQVWRDPEGSR